MSVEALPNRGELSVFVAAEVLYLWYMELFRKQIRLRESWVILALMAVTAMMLIEAFGEVIHHPNNYLFAAGGDGLKTYYSASWYVAHNPSSATHTGFAYPNGNHLVYADLNPALSVLLQWVNHHVTDISAYVPGIINMSIILSFFPCVFFLFLILRKNHLNQGFAFLFAIVITWLSPQIDRFTGHYALAYIFFVPMMWYLLIRLFEGKKIGLWLGLYLGALVLFEFVHPYHFLIGAGFLYAYGFVHILQNLNKWREHLKIYLPALLLGALPIVILLGWQKTTTQTATDFVTYPYGFEHYLAGFETIFFPARPSEYRPSPLWDVYQFTELIDLNKSTKDNLEGSAYVGVVGLVMLGIFLLRMLWILGMGIYFASQAKQRKLAVLWQKGVKRILKPVLPHPLRPAIWASVLLLPLATGWIFDQIPPSLELIDAIRQFRSLGRLAWPFFYVYMVLCAYLLYAFYRRLTIQGGSSKLGLAGIWIALIAAGLWFAESRIMLKRQTTFIFQNTIDPNYKGWRTDYTALLSEQGYKPADFQAILAFPFYHIGSEKLAMEGWHASFFSKAASLDLGLPIINNYVARAPLSSSLETIQLVSHPLIEKKLSQQFPNQKPILLLYTYVDEQPPLREAQYIEQAKLLFQVANMHFAVLPFDAFADQIESSLGTFQQQRDSLFQPYSGVFATDSTQSIVVEGFGDLPFEGAKLGEQAKHFDAAGRLMIFEGGIPSTTANIPMELSIWVRLDQETNYLPSLVVQQFEGEEAVSWDWVDMKRSTDVWTDWVRVAIPFTLQKPTNQIKLFCDGEKLSFDNLLIRPQGVDVYGETREGVSLNNYWLGK